MRKRGERGRRSFFGSAIKPVPVGHIRGQRGIPGFQHTSIRTKRAASPFFNQEQSQQGAVPRNIPLITAAAQPTPERPWMASSGQFSPQAPHSMQASRSTIRALRFSTTKTAWGQTDTHIPQPVHFCTSSVKVTTPGKYLSLVIARSLEPVPECPIGQTNRPATHSPAAATMEAICSGTATPISRRTPEREV